MAKVSVIIPARHEPYLAKTVEDVLVHATGDIEIVVVLDGWKPDAPLKEDRRIRQIHNATSVGLRESVNMAVRAATGEFVMKIDAHCSFAPGFDEIMAADCNPKDIAVPSRYSLNAEEWTRGYGPLEFMFLTYPYAADKQYGEGLHGKHWVGPDGLGASMAPASYYFLERKRADIKIDEIQAFQGSCWFCRRQRFLDLGGFGTQFGTFYQEPQEIAFKFWMSGGRILVNKNTSYDHWHKTIPQNYGFSRNGKHAAMRYSTWYWMNDLWRHPLRTRMMEDFIRYHWPIPSWPDDWREQKVEFEQQHPEWATPPMS